MISGIWESEYVQGLGILDHCREVIKLNEQLIVAKSFGTPVDKVKAKSSLNKEIMDLKLILDKWSVNRSDLALERLEKFIEKHKKEVTK